MKASRCLVCNSKGIRRQDLACLQSKLHSIIARLSIKLLGETAICAPTMPNSHHCCCGKNLIPATAVSLFFLFGFEGYMVMYYTAGAE